MRICKRRLPMQRLRVIDHRRNAFRLESGLNGVPFLAGSETDRVLRPAGAVTSRNDRRCQSLQPLRIPGSHLVHGVQLVIGKSLEFHLQDCGLDRVQPGVQADTDVVVLKRPLAVHAVRRDERGPFVIIRKNSAAVPVASQRLGREERRRRDITETAGSLAANRPAEALGAVFQDQEPVAVGHGPDGLVVSRKAEKVHGHDDTRAEPAFSQHGLDRALQVCSVDVERLFVHIDKNGLSALEGHHLSGGEESEIRNEHGVAGADAPGLERQSEGVRPVRAGQTMLHAYIFRQLLFQFPHLRAHDIGARRHRVQDGPVHFLTEDLILLLEISEFHGFAFARPI